MIRHSWLTLSFIFLAVSAHSNSPTYHVDIRNAPVGDAIRLLSKANGTNIVVPDKLPGRVHANFPNVTIQSAIGAILDSNSLGSQTEGDVVKVNTKKALEDLGHDLVTVTIPLKFAKADKVSPQVKFLLSARGTTTFDQRTNAVTARDTPREIANVRQFIEKIDHADKQVLIEAKIIEATTNYFQGLGVQWGATNIGSNYWVGGPASVGVLDSNRTAIVNSPVIGPNTGLRVSFTPSAALSLDAQITAAEEKGDLSILSRPSIVATNNQPATMHSGAKFYVRTAATGPTVNVSGANSGSSSSSTGTTGAGTAGAGTGGSTTGIQEIESGLTLLVTPQITAGNKINLTISVTESQPDFSNAVDGIPSIVENNATTTVLLENGATTVIGGMFQKNVSNQKNGVPFLSNIPILGYLFGSRTVKDVKKELIIFLKPTLVAEGEKPATQDEAEKRSNEISEALDPSSKT